MTNGHLKFKTFFIFKPQEKTTIFSRIAARHSIPVDTQRHLNIYKTSIRRRRYCTDVL